MVTEMSRATDGKNRTSVDLISEAPRGRVKIRKLSLVGGAANNPDLSLNLKAISTPTQDGRIDAKYFVSIDQTKMKHLSKTQSWSSHTVDKSALEDLSQVRWREQLHLSNSIISDVLMGQTVGKLSCTRCHNSSFNFEAFYTLELSIPPNKDTIDFSELLTHYSRPEQLENFKYDCQTCQTQGPATKTSEIYKLPPILVVCFKRFELKDGTFQKNNTLITINLSGEDLTKFETSGSHSSDTRYVPYCIIVLSSDTASLRRIRTRTLHMQLLRQPRLDSDRRHYSSGDEGYRSGTLHSPSSTIDPTTLSSSGKCPSALSKT